MNILNLINNGQKIIKAVNTEFFTPKLTPKTDIPQHFIGGGNREKKKKSQKKKDNIKIKSKNHRFKSLKKYKNTF